MFQWSHERRAYGRSQILAPMHVDSPLMWTFPNANNADDLYGILSTRECILSRPNKGPSCEHCHFIPEKFTNYENYSPYSKKPLI